MPHNAAVSDEREHFKSALSRTECRSSGLEQALEIGPRHRRHGAENTGFLHVDPRFMPTSALPTPGVERANWSAHCASERTLGSNLRSIGGSSRASRPCAATPRSCSAAACLALAEAPPARPATARRTAKAR